MDDSDTHRSVSGDCSTGIYATKSSKSNMRKSVTQMGSAHRVPIETDQVIRHSRHLESFSIVASSASGHVFSVASEIRTSMDCMR